MALRALRPLARRLSAAASTAPRTVGATATLAPSSHTPVHSAHLPTHTVHLPSCAVLTPCTACAVPQVVALGGNALVRPGEEGTPAQQAARAKEAAVHLAAFPRETEIVVTHGNGPQVCIPMCV